jgi:hypothetical protein
MIATAPTSTAATMDKVAILPAGFFAVVSMVISFYDICKGACRPSF